MFRNARKGVNQILGIVCSKAYNGVEFRSVGFFNPLENIYKSVRLETEELPGNSYEEIR